MTPRHRADDGLSVYGTDGEQYYPDPADGAGRPEVRDWFLSTGLRCYLDTGRPELMVYLGDVRHPRERDQAFAVYEGRDVETLFADFENAVRRELLDGRGWEIIEETAPSDQKSLFHFVAGLGTSNRERRPRPLTEYTDHDPELFQRSLSADNESHAVEPLEVVARDYRVAVELLETYSDVVPIRIHVYDNQDVRPPDEADLVVEVEPGPYEVTVPTATAELLASLRHRLESHKANERKEATVEAIASHAEREDDPEIVREAVEAGFEEYYDSFEVVRTRRRERLERELADTKHELRRANSRRESVRAELESERRRRKRLERKADVTELLETVYGSLRRPFGTGGTSAEAGRLAELDLETDDGSSDEAGRSWSSAKITVPLVLLILVILIVALDMYDIYDFSPIINRLTSVPEIDVPTLPSVVGYALGSRRRPTTRRRR